MNKLFLNQDKEKVISALMNAGWHKEAQEILDSDFSYNPSPLSVQDIQEHNKQANNLIKTVKEYIDIIKKNIPELNYLISKLENFIYQIYKKAFMINVENSSPQNIEENEKAKLALSKFYRIWEIQVSPKILSHDKFKTHYNSLLDNYYNTLGKN